MSFFFSSRRRHTRLVSDWSSDGALPISGMVHRDGVLNPLRMSHDLNRALEHYKEGTVAVPFGEQRLSGAHLPGMSPGSESRRSEEHTSELQSLTNLVCRLLLEKKKTNKK